MRLHVHHFGDPNGAPLVFLHGIAGQGTRAGDLSAGLGERFRVLGPDLRGHGRSSWDPPWGLADHIADVRETLAAEGIASAVFVGHSFGGRIISELDAGLVERAVLIDPALYRPPAESLVVAAEWARPTYGSVEEAVGAEYAFGGLIRAPRDLIRTVRARELEKQPDGRLADRVFHPAVLAGVGEVSRAWPERPPQVPTLVLLGAQSTLRVDASVARYRELLGDLLTVEILEAGHSVLWDAAPEAHALIDAFL